MRVPGPGAEVVAVDPFDLPDWVGEREVTWRSASALGTTLVPGELVAAGADAAESLACDLLACDRAYPEPSLPEQWRREAHAQWALQQVLLVEVGQRLTLVCPGTDVDVDAALESLRRLAKAVGVSSSRFTVAVRL